MKYRRRENLDHLAIERVFEMCAVELEGEGERVLAVSVYRPPDSNCDLFFDALNKFLHFIKFELRNRKIVICGDFNIDILQSSPMRTKFTDVIGLHNLTYNVNEPTRVSENSAKAIDNILTNFSPHSPGMLVFETGLSDHYAQVLKFAHVDGKMNSVNFQYCARRSISNNKLGIFCSALTQETWAGVYCETDANKCFNKFLNIFSGYFEEAFPKKFIKSGVLSNLKKWITRGIRVSCERKRELCILSKTERSVTFVNYVKSYKKILKKVILAAKKMSNDDYIRNSKSTIRASWDVVKRELGKVNVSRCVREVISKDAGLITSPRKIATAMNSYFLGVADGIARNISTGRVRTPLLLLGGRKFDLRGVDEEIVDRVIRSLRDSSSTGWDEIPSKVLKACRSLVSGPLAHAISLSFRQGIFPDKLKYCVIHPSQKTKTSTEISNFRPIANLSIFSKVYERCFLRQLSDYMSSNKILNCNQHGYTPGKSTATAIYELCNGALGALDGSLESAAIFCDLSKAFDCVNHGLLLSKLEGYGIAGVSNSWIRSFLTDRKQRVSIRSEDGTVTLSDWQGVRHGVPQGSTLGPILFVCYVNDLNVQVPDSHITLFADDTSVLVNAKNSNELVVKMNNVLTELSGWFNDNGLLLNVDKTKIIKFGCRQDTSNINTLAGVDLVNATEFLGIRLDGQLKWSDHINVLYKKLCTASFNITTLIPVVSPMTLRSVYYANFYSHLKYGIIMWGSASALDRIFKVQKRVVRCMAGLGYRDSCKPAFRAMKLMSLPSLYIYEILLFVRNNKDKFDGTKISHTYGTRHRGVYQYPIHRLTLYESGPFYSALRIYNKLPTQVKVIQDYSKYKIFVKELLVKKCYYTVREYLEDNSVAVSFD